MRVFWVAYTNTDCTEGRGRDVAIATCEIEATAVRLARGRYVQGSDGPVRPIELLFERGQWWVPCSLLNVIAPTSDDLATQKALDNKKAAITKAKAAGLTDDDLKALGAK